MKATSVSTSAITMPRVKRVWGCRASLRSAKGGDDGALADVGRDARLFDGTYDFIAAGRGTASRRSRTQT